MEWIAQTEDHIAAERLPFVDALVTNQPFTCEDFPVEVGMDQEVMHAIRYDKKKAAFGLEKYLRKYPGNPVLMSWLSYTYDSIGQKRKAHALLEENYQKNPTNLFARADYAVYQIKYHKNHLVVPSLFEGNFKLHELYPEQEMFHTAQIMAFYHALGLYFVCEEDFKTATLLVNTLRAIGCENVEAVEDIEYALRDAKIKQAMWANTT